MVKKLLVSKRITVLLFCVFNIYTIFGQYSVTRESFPSNITENILMVNSNVETVSAVCKDIILYLDA